MMAMIVEVISWLLMLSGSVFVVIGALGMVRMPDLFSRMQAASIIDTFGAGLLLAGFMLQSGFTLVTLKLLFLLALLFYIGPVISHALARAALHEGVKPILSNDRRGRLDAGKHKED
jgi:multicomponent Na+:H+ antiporter subunit G